MEQKSQPDLLLFILTIVLVGIGAVMVYDASYAVAGEVYHNTRFFVTKQAMFAVVGVVLMAIAMNLPFWWLKRAAGLILVLSVFGLVAVFVPHIGHASRGATRWIAFGPIQVQPSEFAKLGLVIYLAAALSYGKRNLKDINSIFLPIVAPVLIVAFLVVKEDMGTAIVLVITALAMMFMAGARKDHLLMGILLGAFAGAIAVIHEPYRLQRIMAFKDPFKDYHGIGYQVCQSLIALGSGGIFGAGFGESRQKLGYLPASYTDFVYAIMGQEGGLIVAALIAGLFFLFAWRGFVIASRTKDPFGRLLAAGISILISGQALLNMLVVTSSVPATGVPLPFISYGGSSLALNLLCVGVLLGVSRYPKVVEEHQGESSIDGRRDRRARVSRAKYRRSHL